MKSAKIWNLSPTQFSLLFYPQLNFRAQNEFQKSNLLPGLFPTFPGENVHSV